VETVDGFLVNVTDRHRLQRQIIQTEELRTLSEVSARLAHEIRNPVAAAGGFALRLLSSLPEEDPNRGKVQIIVREVARLEKILETTLGYLKPFEVVLERSSLNEVMENVVEDLRGLFKERSVSLVMDLAPRLPLVLMDRLLFRKVLDSVLMALVSYCRAGGEVGLRTFLGENVIQLEMVAKEVQVSEDDIQHFFYPFMSREDPSKSLDLPLAKMIIHKHRGLIHLAQKHPDQLVLNISLPF
jgi:nitrogen-specific signal transduction histidine kinase